MANGLSYDIVHSLMIKAGLLLINSSEGDMFHDKS